MDLTDPGTPAMVTPLNVTIKAFVLTTLVRAVTAVVGGFWFGKKARLKLTTTLPDANDNPNS